MIENGLKIYAQREPWDNSIGIAFGEKREGRMWHIAQPLTFVESPTGAITEPTIRLKQEEAQRLMDELWVCGLRPSEGTGSAGALAATQKHLDDMRKLVFDMRVTQV